MVSLHSRLIILVRGLCCEWCYPNSPKVLWRNCSKYRNSWKHSRLLYLFPKKAFGLIKKAGENSNGFSRSLWTTVFFPSCIKTVILILTSDLQCVFVRTPKQKFPFHPKSQTMSINFPLEHLSGRLRIIPYSSRNVLLFLHSLVDTRPDLPAHDCGRAIFQSSSQRTEAERGDSLQPVPMPIYPRQRWSVSPHAKQLRTWMIPSWWRH